jgi:hypothetical protein
MKIFLKALGLLFFCSPVFAAGSVQYINAYGDAYGTCSGQTSFFCVRDLERSAADAAERDADYQCWALKGELEYTSLNDCFFSSSPSYIPPDSPGTFVSVHANCHYRCDIKEQ